MANSKLKHWLIDYVHLLRGGVAMYIHRNPPPNYIDSELSKTPIILVPGFLEKWGFLKPLGDFLASNGHPIFVIPRLGHNIADIPSASSTLRQVVVQALPNLGHHIQDVRIEAKKLRQYIDQQNLSQVVIVAHSKGGLIGKYYLVHQNQDQRVVGMVAVATPFKGSALAKLIPHPSVQELTARHQIIQALETHKAVNHQIISIYPTFDNHIWTENGSFLEGAENIQVKLNGHHRVLFDRGVQNLILKSVDKLTKQSL